MSSLSHRLAQGRGETRSVVTTSHKPVKDKKYEDFIHLLPCVVRGSYEVQAAHICGKNPNYGHTGRGMHSRPSSCWTLPLCEPEHAIQTSYGNSGEGEARYWREQGINPYALASVLYARWCEHRDNPEEALRLCTEIIARAKSLG